MSEEVGIRALQQNASAVVAWAAAGEVVTITDRGRPVAQLGPVAETRLDALIRTGRASPARSDLSELPPPPHRKRGQPPLSEVLDEMRAGERY